ncbi:hypothetical protein TNCV_942181 [Trichonephila clavipes]|nr:hypothetical protein TNCV_942181 [Trichonephila clavipes]
MNETTQQEKTTELSSRNEQLNSAAGTKQLNSPVGTKQLNSSVGTKQLNSALPSTAYNAYNRLQPPAPPAPPAPPLQQNRLFYLLAFHLVNTSFFAMLPERYN